jgi:hypothetical protein
MVPPSALYIGSFVTPLCPFGLEDDGRPGLLGSQGNETHGANAQPPPKVGPPEPDPARFESSAQHATTMVMSGFRTRLWQFLLPT